MLGEDKSKISGTSLAQVSAYANADPLNYENHLATNFIMSKSKIRRTETLNCPLCDTIVLDSDEAVLCDGPCAVWYHRICLGMMDDHYTKIAKNVKGYKTWFCPFCDEPDPPNSPQYVTVLSQMQPTIKSSSKTLDELTLELSHAEEDLASYIESDNPLRLAGEIGNALLSENSALKAKLLQSENSGTAKDLEIENLLFVNDNLRSRLEDLSNLYEDSQRQIVKINQEKANLQNIFEEHDLDLTRIIREQESQILKLKRNFENCEEFSKSSVDTTNSNFKNDHKDEMLENQFLKLNDIEKNLTKLASKHNVLELRISAIETKVIPVPHTYAEMTEDPQQLQSKQRLALSSI
ncbi:hypothetical protein J6590_031618 [Homalodisca vitripennis]|nr:hypothetical protein J6590_031618 [Homalodisca vitripennis]